MHSHTRKEKSGARLQKYHFSRFLIFFFKLHVSNCVAQGLPAYLFVLPFLPPYLTRATGLLETKTDVHVIYNLEVSHNRHACNCGHLINHSLTHTHTHCVCVSVCVYN